MEDNESLVATGAGDEFAIETVIRNGEEGHVCLDLTDGGGDNAIAILSREECRELVLTLLRHGAALGWAEDS